MAQVPIIDVSPLVDRSAARQKAAREIGAACRDNGFFYVRGHGVSEALQERLHRLSETFFALPEPAKMRIAMSHGGRAWRGYFPLGGELTSGQPDIKEGIYFGAELAPGNPLPLHGPNLFPAEVPELKPTVLEYLGAMTELGHSLMEGIALSLDLDADYFREHYTADPLILFRIFNYPAPARVGAAPDAWGVGEHTDYGVLTILKQDDSGGLEVKSRQGWIPAPPVPGTFVCNIGDMLDRMTGGRYRSTPHRVRNPAGRARLSFPFFFDPSFQAKVERLPLTGPTEIREDRDERWDKESVHAFQGTYGEYLMRKIGKVFPDLGKAVLSVLCALLFASPALAKRLLLIGGGTPPPAALARFVRDAGARILIVPWASEQEREAFEDWRDGLAPFHPGIVEAADRTRIHEQLAAASAVFFTGGDQSRLMAELHRLQLSDELRERYAQGVLFGGTSAGTAIMSRAMITPEGVAEGLGLLPERVIVDQHFLVRGREPRLLAALAAHPGYQGLGIDEGMAVALEGGHIREVFGPTEVRVYGCGPLLGNLP